MMSTAEQREEHKALQQQQRDTLNTIIREQVVHILGEPSGLGQVQVRRLWGNFYRVNILSGADAATIRFVSSYFLKSDNDGNIVESTPKMLRRTEKAAS
jgi:hypothetical protein